MKLCECPTKTHLAEAIEKPFTYRAEYKVENVSFLLEIL